MKSLTDFKAAVVDMGFSSRVWDGKLIVCVKEEFYAEEIIPSISGRSAVVAVDFCPEMTLDYKNGIYELNCEGFGETGDFTITPFTGHDKAINLLSIFKEEVNK